MTKHLPKTIAPLSHVAGGQEGLDASEIVLWDKENPRSVLNLLPPVVSKRIGDAAFEKDTLFRLDEQALYKHLSELGHRPNATDNRLRIKFWHEYERVQAQNLNEMIVTNITSGIVSREFFYSHYLHVPEKLAWLMCPPTNYIVKAEEALEFALEQMRDILETPHTLPGGKLDPKVADMKIKIFKLLDDRVRGAVIQRVHTLAESRSMVSIETRTTPQEAATVAGVVQGLTQEETARRIRELEARKRSATHVPAPIKDVTGAGSDAG